MASIVSVHISLSENHPEVRMRQDEGGLVTGNPLLPCYDVTLSLMGGAVPAAGKIGGTPAGPFLECFGKNKRIAITHFCSDVLHLQARFGQKLGRALHSQKGYVMHRAAAQFTIAEPAQVFRTDMSDLSELFDIPFRVQVRSDLFPELGETVITLPGPGKSVDVIMNQFDPMMNGFRRAAAQAILVQSKDRVLQGLRAELREARRSRGNAGLLIWRFVKADPAKSPAPAFHRMKSVQHVRQKKKCRAGGDPLPLAIREHTSFTAETREEERSAQVCTHHAIGK